MRLVLAVVVVAVSICRVQPAAAQSPFAATFDPEPIGAGKLGLEIGAACVQNATYPVSGLTGNLFQIGTYAMTFGLSRAADLSISGAVQNRLFITARDLSAPDASLVTTHGGSTADVEDVVIATRAQLKAEGARHPSLAVRFFTRLPNAKHPSGLGLDTMDFGLALMTRKQIARVRLVGNAGWSILEAPTELGVQNDIVTYGGSIGTEVTSRLHFDLDAAGRANTRHGTPPVGTESRSMIRAGVSVPLGHTQYNVAVLHGLNHLDPGWGVSAGMTWITDAFGTR